MISSEFFIKNIVGPDIFNKFKKVPILKSVKLRVHTPDITEVDDAAILDCFCLLSFIGRNKLQCIKVKKKIDKRHFLVSFEYFAEIRGEVMFEFLYYFILCRFNYIITMGYDVSKESMFMLRNFFFIIEDVNFWLNLPEEFKGFRWPVTVELCFDTINDDETGLFLYFLNSLKFSNLDKRAFVT
jgi:hypothetical protein